MYIIEQIKNESGSYSALQEKSYIPDGYMEYPAEFYDIFYPADKECAGFVDLTITDGKITAVTWNEEAYQMYIESLPDPETEPEVKTNEELTAENKLLKAQVEALTTNQTFLEDCLIEVGQVIYA